jgi:hypothetical protein
MSSDNADAGAQPSPSTNGFGEIRSFNYAGGGCYTGIFQLSLEELEKGYRCGKIIYENVPGFLGESVFLGKYWEDKNTGKTQMVEGTLTRADGIEKYVGKFWENKADNGIFMYTDGRGIARILPYD